MSTNSDPSQPPHTPRRDPYRLTGETFAGRYRLDEYAGAGSFGAVYRATDTRIGRTVAVKILKPDIKDTDQEGARELFQREALTAGRLTHPNIVAVTDTGEEQGFAYLVMEWLEGRTLEDELKLRAPLAPEETAQLLSSIADALQTAHDAGVIHRDIKPSNIHLGRAGRTHVKVLDFGISKVIKSSAAVASRIAGTLSYMSPEQLTGDVIDGRADIYALGIMIYQMLTGALPFDGETQGQIIHQQIVAPVPPLKNVRPDLAPALTQVVQRSMAKNAEERQQSAQELAQEFFAALQSAGHQVAPQHFQSQHFQAAGEPAPRASGPLPSNAGPLSQLPPAAPSVPVSAPVAAVPAPPIAARPLAPAAAMPVQPVGHQTRVGPLSEENVVAADLLMPQTASQIRIDLLPVRNFALIGAIALFVMSIGVGLLSRRMGWGAQPEKYDEFILALVPVALRDMFFGAFLGASLSELRRPSPRWAATNAQWARSLIVYGATGAALLMLPFVLLRTSLLAIPFYLAGIGLALGMLTCALRLATQRIAKRARRH